MIVMNDVARSSALALSNATRDAAQATERISTTLRINNAKDDPAGLMMANRLKAQVSSHVKAVDNINAAISMVQSADKGLSSTTSTLLKMRELALSSSTGTTTGATRTSNQTALELLRSSISSTTTSVTFNGIRLLDGSSSSVVIQTGVETSDKVTINLFDVRPQSIGDGASYVSDINISTESGGSNALTVIDKAIEMVSSYQALAGAQNNVLDYRKTLNTNQSTIRSTAYGNVMNADLAAEAANLASAEIRKNAAAAMVAQANLMSKQVVSYLLKPYTG